MTLVRKTKCDGSGCKNKIDTSNPFFSEYHRLLVGGSDFGLNCLPLEARIYDFCSFKCLHSLITKWIEEGLR